MSDLLYRDKARQISISSDCTLARKPELTPSRFRKSDFDIFTTSFTQLFLNLLILDSHLGSASLWEIMTLLPLASIASGPESVASCSDIEELPVSFIWTSDFICWLELSLEVSWDAHTRPVLISISAAAWLVDDVATAAVSLPVGVVVSLAAAVCLAAVAATIARLAASVDPRLRFLACLALAAVSEVTFVAADADVTLAGAVPDVTLVITASFCADPAASVVDTEIPSLLAALPWIIQNYRLLCNCSSCSGNSLNKEHYNNLSIRTLFQKCILDYPDLAPQLSRFETRPKRDGVLTIVGVSHL